MCVWQMVTLTMAVLMLCNRCVDAPCIACAPKVSSCQKAHHAHRPARGERDTTLHRHTTRCCCFAEWSTSRRCSICFDKNSIAILYSYCPFFFFKRPHLFQHVTDRQTRCNHQRDVWHLVAPRVVDLVCTATIGCSATIGCVGLPELSLRQFSNRKDPRSSPSPYRLLPRRAPRIIGEQ